MILTHAEYMKYVFESTQLSAFPWVEYRLISSRADRLSIIELFVHVQLNVDDVEKSLSEFWIQMILWIMVLKTKNNDSILYLFHGRCSAMYYLSLW